MRIHIHTHTHTYIHGYIYIHIRTYKYIYIYTYTYAYAHIYIYISTSIAYAHPVESAKKMCISGIKGSLKALREVLDGLAQTTSSVVQSVSLVMMAGQCLSAIVSPSIDMFFYAHYCGLWCNALLALHIGIDSAVTVFTRALSAYVAYQTCLGVANVAVLLACAAVVYYVHT